MDPVVEQGLKAIKGRINISTGFVDQRDKGSAIELLRKLHESGYRLNSNEIVAWASNNEFQSKYAQQLGDFVEGVNAGKRYRIGKKPYWKEDIVDTLKERSERI
ncbi:DUF1889 family protein [Clostridium coskatii]|uniref:Uncharacterized protein n=1 Tax=Clostridium coskatii TaxID=1705578 RepID=A0A166TTH4_9CLOT|nr:DUF1889 family protein [Clostridium coskatii]OAA94071.1 hypothetical protein WX73_03641 [Clostridium coskatii]OBR96633.1 hypothetical protein CLCOS_07950 [Clostridium coskatii]